MRDELKGKIVQELERIMSECGNLGVDVIEISAGKLEKAVGLQGRAPAVCNAMRSVLAPTDMEIRKDSVKKDSTTNVFRYDLSVR